MRIFADVCVHTDLVEALRLMGFAVERAVEHHLSKLPDEKIYEYAQKHGYVLLSYDKDFGNIVRFDIARSKGIVLIYVDGLTGEQIIQRALYFFNHHSEKSIKGRLCLVERDTERYWPA